LVAGRNVQVLRVPITLDSMPYPSVCRTARSATLPLGSIVTSTTTSPWMPWGRTERSGAGLGENVVSAIWMEPEPQESDPLLESGLADAGEETLGEGAASVTVRCGNGGKWMGAGAVVEATTVGPDTRRGGILVCG